MAPRASIFVLFASVLASSAALLFAPPRAQAAPVGWAAGRNRCSSAICMAKKGGKPKGAKNSGGRKQQGQQEKKAVRDQRQDEFSKQVSGAPHLYPCKPQMPPSELRPRGWS